LTGRCDVTNNACVSRQVLAVGLVLSLQLAALSAPLIHAHPDDHATPHHAVHEVHAHFSPHSHASHPSHKRGESSLDNNDGGDRALYLRLFVGVARATIEIAAAVPQPYDLVPSTQRRSLRPLFGVHTHDPPIVSAIPSRAPPPLLS
jgi:hypothetical protein